MHRTRQLEEGFAHLNADALGAAVARRATRIGARGADEVEGVVQVGHLGACAADLCGAVCTCCAAAAAMPGGQHSKQGIFAASIGI
jgi:hypothetical protein